MMVIDAGADRGVTPGTRIAVYRDVQRPGMPLAAVGDAVVVTAGPTIAVARVTRARDAVQMGDYVVVITGDPKEPGGINGGIFITPPGATKELNAYSCVVGVDDVDQAMANVKAAGGQVMGDKMDIPTVGTFARCKDTEGNIFTLLQPLPM